MYRLMPCQCLPLLPTVRRHAASVLMTLIITRVHLVGPCMLRQSRTFAEPSSTPYNARRRGARGTLTFLVVRVHIIARVVYPACHGVWTCTAHEIHTK